MVTDPEPRSPFPAYKEFWNRLKAEQPALERILPLERRIGVQWGHAVAPGESPRVDEKLTGAQERTSKLINYGVVKRDPGPKNVIMSGPLGRDWGGAPGVRWGVMRLRETLVQYGLADVVYYASTDGE